MRNFLLGLFLGTFVYAAFAGNISTPPPLGESPAALQHYLKEIQENINKFDITKSAPDGTKKGIKGQHILYNNSGTFTLWVNVDNSTDWQQI